MGLINKIFGGPLGQGVIAGESVVCPWHSWSFNLKTGQAEYPVKQQVRVYPLKLEDDEVLVELE